MDRTIVWSEDNAREYLYPPGDSARFQPEIMQALAALQTETLANNSTNRLIFDVNGAAPGQTRTKTVQISVAKLNRFLANLEDTDRCQQFLDDALEQFTQQNKNRHLQIIIEIIP
jgi:hypothetical protein